MFIEERHQQILAIIAERGSITTSDIISRFGISYDSAKRDLRLLEEKGQLKRTHGGAIPVGQLAIGMPKRTSTQEPTAKPRDAAIARRAASLIQKNEMIFLADDPIGSLVAEHLPRDHGLYAVVNSVAVAEVLRHRRDVKTILIGGEMDEKGSCFDGFALETVKRMRFDKAFVTTDGLSAEFGLSISHGNKIPFWSAVMEASKQRIGLFPADKIGKDASFSLCQIGKLDLLITDENAPTDRLGEFAECGVRICIASEE